MPGKIGSDRQRAGEALRDREGAVPVAEMRVCRSQVDGIRVVATRLDAALTQAGGERERVASLDHEQVPDGVAPGRDAWEPQVADAVERLE